MRESAWLIERPGPLFLSVARGKYGAPDMW